MSKASESDIRMMIATQVAYLDCVEGKSVQYNIDRIIRNYENNPHPSEKEQGQYETAIKLQQRLSEYNCTDCYDWTVKKTCDNNNKDGFYGCLIDTNDGEAILGFRGSESYDGTQKINDWLNADFGLLNSSLTTQQKTAQEFVKQIYEEYGNQYSAYNFSGHSLGGNLAEHATITAPDGMSIGRCTNWDGPGFSDEYIETHALQIKDRISHVDHYQYSVVGSLLFHIPGSNYVTIAAHNGEGLLGAFLRHDTINIDFDENGNIVKETLGNMTFGDFVSKYIAGKFAALSIYCETILPLLISASPYLSAIKLCIKTFEGVISKGIEVIAGAFTDVYNAVKGWLQKVFGGGVDGEFEIYTSAVSSATDQVDNISQQFMKISTEVASIASKIKYESITGSYYKSRIKTVGNSINSYGMKGKKLTKAAHSAVHRTSNDDSKVADSFAALK